MTSPGFPQLENMTVKTVRDYLARKTSIIIPVGVIEQHGYHLPLNTDALIASRLALLIGQRLKMLVAPTMHHSFSGGACPGTINISPATMSLVISDMLLSLADQGFRSMHLLLCHGGSENARALDNALKMLLRMNPLFENVLISLIPVWDLCAPDTGYRKGFSEGDWHGGWLETSLVMALEPDRVDMKALKTDNRELMKKMIEHPDNYQQAEKIVDDEHVIPRMRQNPELKVGIMGFPERASREQGEEIVRHIVKSGCRKISGLERKSDGKYKKVKLELEPILLK